MIVRARFTDPDGNPRGREYTYGCNDPADVGAEVFTAEGKKLIITATDVPYEEGAVFGDRLRYLTTTPPAEDETAQEIILPELTVDASSVIVVQQLPMIAEQLRDLSAGLKMRIASVTALACTPETKTTIKKHRAALNTIFKDLESRRIAVKKQILAPYDEFEVVYKECVTDPFRQAFVTLDERTSAIDSEIKNELLADVKDYFAEHALCEGVEWLTWERSGIAVGLSSNKTALRRAAKDFIDRVVADIAMIDTQDEAVEMHVEYRKALNAALAIKTVKDRIAAVEREKIRQEEMAAAKIAEDERRKAMATAALQAEVQRVAPPVVAPPAAAAPPAQEPTCKAAFMVEATREQIMDIARYMREHGIKYSQVPLKNIIMEVSSDD